MENNECFISKKELFHIGAVTMIILFVILFVIFCWENSEIELYKYEQIENTKPHTKEELAYLTEALANGKISEKEEREFYVLHEQMIKRRLIQP